VRVYRRAASVACEEGAWCECGAGGRLNYRYADPVPSPRGSAYRRAASVACEEGAWCECGAGGRLNHRYADLVLSPRGSAFHPATLANHRNDETIP
jgi:hypothetical protein